MLVVRDNSKIIPVTIIYFDQRTSFKNGLFCVYKSASINKDFFFFKRESLNTLLVSLLGSEDQLLNSFQKNTTYEIRRSIKDGFVHIEHNASIEDFILLYNRFALKRGWSPFKLKNEMLQNLHVTACKLNNEVVVAHLYLLDIKSKRVSLQSSVSDIDELSDLSLKALIGRANRHLHYFDMLYFKKNGYQIYDFGGYDNYNINDKKKIGINKFKEGFNGVLVFESNYTSYPLYFLLKIKKIVSFLIGK